MMNEAKDTLFDVDEQAPHLAPKNVILWPSAHW